MALAWSNKEVSYIREYNHRPKKKEQQYRAARSGMVGARHESSGPTRPELVFALCSSSPSKRRCLSKVEKSALLFHSRPSHYNNKVQAQSELISKQTDSPHSKFQNAVDSPHHRRNLYRPPVHIHMLTSHHVTSVQCSSSGCDLRCRGSK